MFSNNSITKMVDALTNVFVVPMRVNNMTFDVYDDPVFMALIDANCVMCIASSCLAIYLIVWKSPLIIGKYKWYLMNIAICSFIYDFYVTFIWRPMLFFPSPTMCSTGVVFRSTGWLLGGLIAYLFYPILWGICSMSIVWAFVYRWAVLADRSKQMNSKWGILAMGIIQFLYEMPTTILYCLSASDRPKVLAAILKHYPNLAPWVLENKPCAITSFDANKWAFPFIVSMNIQFIVGFPLSLLFLFLALRQLKAQDKNMSSTTAKMHRDMLRALIMQLFVPFVAMFLPYSIGAFLVMLEINWPCHFLHWHFAFRHQHIHDDCLYSPISSGISLPNEALYAKFMDKSGYKFEFKSNDEDLTEITNPRRSDDKKRSMIYDND